MTNIAMHADQELPAIRLTWNDSTGAPYDFSTGWTATVKVCAVASPSTLILAKTAGITLAATAPNYVIEFTAVDLATITAAITPSTYGTSVYVYAYIRRDADSKDMVFRPGSPIVVNIYPAPA